MGDGTFMTVDEVAEVLGVAKSTAYSIVHNMNLELQKMGYLTVRGRVSTNYFYKKVRYEDNEEK